MASLAGRCIGLVKNSASDLPEDQNCFWKSGDLNYGLATFGNDKVTNLLVFFSDIFPLQSSDKESLVL